MASSGRVNTPSPSNNPSPNGRGGIPTTDPQTSPDAEVEFRWKKLSEYTTIIENKSDRILSLQKSAFTLANCYFVSQAVIFTAISTNTSLVCRDVWFPLFLSLLPGALNLFAFFKIGQEYIDTKISRKEYLKKKAELMVGTGLYLSDEDDENNRIVDRKKTERHLYICMCAFGFLAAVVAVGSLWMLCGESIIVKHNAKCVKLCN